MSNLFDWIKSRFRKTKPNIYLGNLGVVPREDLQRFIDGFAQLRPINLEDSLRSELVDLVALPLASERQNPLETDLALDMFVAGLRAGSFFPASDIPFFLRPRVTVAVHLYEIESGRSIHSTSITKTMPWKEFFARGMTARALIGFGAKFEQTDIKKLFYEASLQAFETLLRKL